jgi:hypothetical protein
MNRRKLPYPSDDELLARMEALGRELGIAGDVLHRRLYRRRRQPAIAGFPFNLLERVVRGGLAFVERTVARLVRTVVR